MHSPHTCNVGCEIGLSSPNWEKSTFNTPPWSYFEYVQSFMFKVLSYGLLVDSAPDLQHWESFDSNFPVYAQVCSTQ